MVVGVCDNEQENDSGYVRHRIGSEFDEHKTL